MTVNETIKALEEWSERGMTFCNVGMSEFARNILGLINRQKAEIERLNEVVERLQKHNRALCMLEKMQIDRIESEARKEFAEGLKNIYLNDKRYDRPNPHTLLIKLFDNIDNLLKEMEVVKE